MVRDRRAFTLIEPLMLALALFGAVAGIVLSVRDGVLACVGFGLAGAVIGLLSPLALLIPFAAVDACRKLTTRVSPAEVGMSCQRRGVTLIELIPIMLMIFGVVMGISHGAPHGVLAAVGFALLGAVLGLFSPLLFLLPLSLLDRYEYGPPRCFKGTCGRADYTWDLQVPQRLCRCRCGDQYELIDDRFVRHFADGLQLNYMKRDRLGRWRPEARSSARPEARSSARPEEPSSARPEEPSSARPERQAGPSVTVNLLPCSYRC